MSTASKLTLGVTSLSAVVTVLFVHYSQRWEKAAMHEGVLRDMEMQRQKQERVQQERLQDFEMQRALEQEYRKVQSVSDGTGPK
ncbi:hypothetical protein K402DRAFT_328605 [Aulographum hederae CBS 113979]|uniref:Cytochrome c oxidase assembly protein n=1 Tax=Aulographum hederae CBS 113979 TaxID=1176131 RepID=A0A6G1H686_9PEZI|nr:hypothetical protein K402DRAFT_328605 [Aulographum hederae CBS 113979]